MNAHEKSDFAKASIALKHLAQENHSAAVSLLAELNATNLSPGSASEQLRVVKWAARFLRLRLKLASKWAKS
jgi:hypothetical protein